MQRCRRFNQCYHDYNGISLIYNRTYSFTGIVMHEGLKMDPIYLAISLYRRRHYEKCLEVCTDILNKEPLDQTAWCLKMRAQTQRVYVDDLESEVQIGDNFLDDNTVASSPRPGTSITSTSTANLGYSARPRTSTSRAVTSGRARSAMKKSLDVTRVSTARPLTSQSARAIRLGTAAIYSEREGPFIQVSRLNISKYAQNSYFCKPLFEYLFYHEGDVRNAMKLAVEASQHYEFNDWWWKVQLSKCYIMLNMIREAEQQLKSAVKQCPHVETIIRLTRIYLRLNQPFTAMEVCKTGLDVFPKDVSIMTELARYQDLLNDTPNSVKYYRTVVVQDAMNTEAIASIGMYHFYNNQPELSLRYYRRLFAIGVYSAELYNNLSLCCEFAQQIDLTLVCFERALAIAEDPRVKAEVWYNLSFLAITVGDMELATQCLNLCLSLDPSHASAFNNLAVLYHKMGKTNMAKAYFTFAKGLDPELVEAETNLNYLKMY